MQVLRGNFKIDLVPFCFERKEYSRGIFVLSGSRLQCRLVHYYSFLLFLLYDCNFSFSVFFFPLFPVNVVFLFFPFRSLCDSLLPFPLINQSTRCSKEFKERFSNSRETPLVFYLSFYRIDRTYRKPIVSHPRHVESVTF